MKIVIALGGNALLQRGEVASAENQLKSVKKVADIIANIAKENDVIITHGNGPQVGLLALQGEAYTEVPPYPLDNYVAQTQGMIGTMLQTELTNNLGGAKNVITLLTHIQINPTDSAFNDPTKFIGPVYDKNRADQLKSEKGWVFKEDGDKWRRVVPSPEPTGIMEIDTINKLSNEGNIVICAGGGGIPVKTENGTTTPLEAVIDKDLASALLAEKIGADKLIILTDVDGVYENFGTADQHIIETISVSDSSNMQLPNGSMGPKVKAAANYAQHTHNEAHIGSLSHLSEIIAGTSGTRVQAS